MKTIEDFFNSQVKINDDEKKMLKSIIEIRKYKKGEQIHYKDNIWTHFIYINHGIMRSYIINDKGKEFTRQFFFNTKESSISNLFAIDLSSIILQEPSMRGFEVLEDSEASIFSKQDLEKLFDRSKTFERIGRVFMGFGYIDMDRYYNSLLAKSAKERYMHLVHTMANLIKQVPQYHIASYLGITPESLSRIRKEI